jgi:hypothetical protein
MIMHGLETPPKDPSNTVTWVIGVVIVGYILASIAWRIWEAFH